MTQTSWSIFYRTTNVQIKFDFFSVILTLKPKYIVLTTYKIFWFWTVFVTVFPIRLIRDIRYLDVTGLICFLCNYTVYPLKWQSFFYNQNFFENKRHVFYATKEKSCKFYRIKPGKHTEVLIQLTLDLLMI